MLSTSRCVSNLVNLPLDASLQYLSDRDRRPKDVRPKLFLLVN